MPFLTRLAVVFAGAPQKNAQANFVLLEPLEYLSGTGEKYTVPATFTTDFASVPRLPILYAVFGNRGHSVRPAVLHDYLCRFDVVPRAQADRLFYQAMLDDGMPENDAMSMYWAVRAYSELLPTRYTTNRKD